MEENRRNPKSLPACRQAGDVEISFDRLRIPSRVEGRNKSEYPNPELDEELVMNRAEVFTFGFGI